jgi:predicted DNA-binding transcriptional regulator AlpA
MPTEPEELWTTQQVAAFLQLSERTLEESRTTGNGPLFVKLSRKAVRYRPADVHNWIASRVRKSTAEYKDGE